MTIQTITRKNSNNNIMAQALAKAGLVEDKEILVEERATNIKPIYGEQHKSKGYSDTHVLATWMAAVSTMNEMDEEASYLFLQELSCEEHEDDVQEPSVVEAVLHTRKVVNKARKQATSLTMNIIDMYLNKADGDVVNTAALKKTINKRDKLIAASL